MRLYLVRHAQTLWNAESKAQGHTDIDLDETGKWQAQQLKRAFKGVDIERVYSSDLKRSAKTAEAIADATGAPLELREDLRERNYGDWEGQPFEAIAALNAEAAKSQGSDLYRLKPPNGESMEDVWERLGPIAELLRNAPRPVAVVTHGGTAALLLSKLLHGSLATSKAFRFANTSVTELVRRPEGLFMLWRYADVAHLEEEALAGGVEGSERRMPTKT
jgi:2,3-bisphosphoglycerate-dependent phosphoglycerate mutase